MTTTRDIIKSALLNINAIQVGEEPTAAEMEISLETFNGMVSSMSNDLLNTFKVTPTRFPLENGKQTYTLGPGGDWDTERPMQVQQAKVMLNPVLELWPAPEASPNNLPQPFTVTASGGGGTGVVPYSVSFSASAPSGATYLWDFGDGFTSDEQNPTHFFETPGTYTPTVTVTLSGIERSASTDPVTAEPGIVLRFNEPFNNYPATSPFAPSTGPNSKPPTNSFPSSLYWLATTGANPLTTNGEDLVFNVPSTGGGLYTLETVPFSPPGPSSAITDAIGAEVEFTFTTNQSNLQFIFGSAQFIARHNIYGDVFNPLTSGLSMTTTLVASPGVTRSYVIPNAAPPIWTTGVRERLTMIIEGNFLYFLRNDTLLSSILVGPGQRLNMFGSPFYAFIRNARSPGPGGVGFVAAGSIVHNLKVIGS